MGQRTWCLQQFKTEDRKEKRRKFRSSSSLGMSHRSFAFTPTALRSLEQERDLLERRRHQRKLTEPAVSGYLLRKEARERATVSRKNPGVPSVPLVCRDPVVQNALYTGDVEAVKTLFPKGSPDKLVIKPEGGAMRWVADGAVRGRFFSFTGFGWTRLLLQRIYSKHIAEI